MKWYKDRPEEGELVVVTITEADKNSAYAELEEYEGLEGLIHISEVSRSWVKDVSKELDEGERNVAQVVDSSDDSIDLSLKRVNQKQKKDAMAKWKKEQKASDFVPKLEEELGWSEEEVYENVIFPLQREFGSSFEGFEVAFGKEERLREVLDDEAVEAVKEVAEENINMKQEKLEGRIELEFSQGDGVDRIKEVFSGLAEGVEVKYISAPEYEITAWGRNSELAKKRMDETVEILREKAGEEGGSFEFSRA